MTNRSIQEILNKVYRQSDGSIATVTASSQALLNLVYDPDASSLKVSEGATSTREVVHLSADTTLSSLGTGAVYHVEVVASEEVDITIPDASSATEGVYATFTLHAGSQLNISTVSGQEIGGLTTQIINETDASITILDLTDHYMVIQDSRTDLANSGLLDLYFDNAASADIGTYKLLDTEPPDGAVATLNYTIDAATKTLNKWVTASGVPNITVLSAGTYSATFQARATNNSDSRLRWRLYKREADTTETLLGTSETSPVLPSTYFDEELHMTIAEPISLAATDRLVIELVGVRVTTTPAPTIAVQIEGTGEDYTGSFASLDVPGPTVNTFVPYEGMTKDIKTDRWLGSDTNTFLGVDVVGGGNLSNPAGSQGWNNTGVGESVFSAITSGYLNTAFGQRSLYRITTGFGNVGVGSSALRDNVSGRDNVAVGTGALLLSTSSFNTALGRSAGDNITTGDYNVIIGYDIDAQSATANGQLSIGNAIFGSGNTATGTTVSSGNLGLFATSWGTSAAKVLSVGNGTAPTTQPADLFQMWSADQAAGNACPHFMTENGATIKLYQQAHVADATTSHSMAGSDTVDQTNLESALDALGTKLNTILTYLENLGFNATS